MRYNFVMSSDNLSIKGSSQLVGPSVAVKYVVLKSPVFVDVKAGAGYYFYNSKSEITYTEDSNNFRN